MDIIHPNPEAQILPIATRLGDDHPSYAHVREGSQGGGSYGGSKGTTSSSANSEPESPRLNWHLPPALPPAIGSAAAQRACAAEGGGSSLVGMLEQELFGEKGQGGADGGEAATAKRQRAARDE